MKLIFAVLAFALTQAAYSGPVILRTDEIKAIIGNFPARNSALEKRDDDILLSYQKARSKADCEGAEAQETLLYRNVFMKPNGPLTSSEVKRLEPKMLMAAGQVFINSKAAKNIYKRPRPYQRNPRIRPCVKLESSTSYPSGHTMVGRVWGRLTAEAYPDREDEIMKVANRVGENRVIGGVHHPSDVEAGWKLGDEIAHRMIND